MKRRFPSAHRLHALVSACVIVVTLTACTSGEPAESDKPDASKAVVAASTARATVEPFSHVDLLLYEGRELDVITQAETIEPYGERIANDYARYTAGTALLETAMLVVELIAPM